MSVLNQLFNRGLLGAKCKTCLTLAISRIKLLQNKRDVHVKQMRKEIAQFLQTGQEAIARIRVEHVLREQNVWAAYEILELFCEFVLARIPVLESLKECPPDLREALASIVFAAPRCSDLPDLLQVKNLFAAKYGKEFILAASELRPDANVNRTLIEKLSIRTPSQLAKLKLLKEIAGDYNVHWDCSHTEAEFSKRHEDLLDGSGRAFSGNTRVVEAPGRASSPEFFPYSKANSGIATRSSPAPSNLSLSGSNEIESSKTNRDAGLVHKPNEVLEKAQTAITAAGRASAAAWAAAELVNKKLGSVKLEGGN